ncbi:MAG: hypothetical protein KDD53_11140, partial [Bdellovibrionales bacterium]|nr:hypothetical protein [Bdellovibrionales bacterium]
MSSLSHPSRPEGSADSAAEVKAVELRVNLAQKGIAVVKSVAQEILGIIDRGELREEEVTIGEFSRNKTSADRISNELMHAAIREKFPNISILSEETRVNGASQALTMVSGEPVAIVDPIDGTVHLKNGDGQWLVNLGFCLDGEAIVGISAVPSENKLYVGVKGRHSFEIGLDGSNRRNLERPLVRERPVFGICSPLDLGGEQKLVDRWKRIAELNGAEMREFGSAYSYLKVADGTLDAFVNLGGNFH